MLRLVLLQILQRLFLVFLVGHFTLILSIGIFIPFGGLAGICWRVVDDFIADGLGRVCFDVGGDRLLGDGLLVLLGGEFVHVPSCHQYARALFMVLGIGPLQLLQISLIRQLTLIDRTKDPALLLHLPFLRLRFLPHLLLFPPIPRLLSHVLDPRLDHAIQPLEHDLPPMVK